MEPYSLQTGDRYKHKDKPCSAITWRIYSPSAEIREYNKQHPEFKVYRLPPL